MKIYLRSLFRVAVYLLFACLILPQSLWAAENPWLDKGDQAVMNENYPQAESHYTKALEADPDSPRVLRALAEVKIALEKYKEAKVLIDKILAMPVANGRDVLVFYKGDSQGQPAELVDELVISPQRTNNNMRNYLDTKSDKPIPHYRLFFKEKGRMELVPQSVVDLKYNGVLRRVYEHVSRWGVTRACPTSNRLTKSACLRLRSISTK